MGCGPRNGTIGIGARVAPRFLADTHVVIRWLADRKKLSQERSRILEVSCRRRAPVAVSAISLLEIAVLEGTRRIRGGAVKVIEALNADPLFRILPMTVEIAIEVALLGASLTGSGRPGYRGECPGSSAAAFDIRPTDRRIEVSRGY